MIKKMSFVHWASLLALICVCAILMFVPDAHAAVVSVAGFSAMDPNLATAVGVGMAGRLSMQQMREKRNELSKETRNLLDKNTHANWDEDSQKKYDENLAEIERLDGAMQREQRMLDLDAEKHFENLGGKERELPEGSVKRLHDTWMRRGDKAIDEEGWATLRQNTMSTTTGSEGGYTVPTEMATTILEALKAYGGMREVATTIRTATGAQMDFPTSNGTSEEGEIVAQNASATDADPTFGTKALNSFKYGSKVIVVPIELLQDSAVDVNGFVFNRINSRIGRITNKHHTIGAGTTEPMGIVTASTAGRAGAVSATPIITYDDLVDLEHSVDPAYRLAPKWMMNDQMVKLVRKLKDSQNRPLWLPSYDAGIRGSRPNELLGNPVVINQHMPVPAASAKSLLFGDFSKYVIRDVMQVTLYRFTDSAYAKKGQVGFLAFMRCDGNLMDIGGAVKHFVHGAAA
jgi:HK97 family phage major capsid protein